MELYQSGPDFYLIQTFKWTLESWEFIVGNSPVPRRFYNPSDIFSEPVLSRTN